MMRSNVGVAVVVLAALIACKSEEKKEAPAPAPTPVAPAATTPAVTAAPAPAPAPEPRAEEPQSKTGVPTTGNSKPPTVAEWNGVGEITVRHSTPLGCETKLVREWLRVSCRSDGKSKHQIEGVELSSGKDSGGIPPFVKKGVASIVTQVKDGMKAEFTFKWDGFSRKLEVSWPHGAPAPTIQFDQSAP